MDDINELYSLFPELKAHICVEKKIGQGTFSYVYLAHFLKNSDEKVALKYIIPTSSPTRTKQEIECLLNIGGRENVVSVLSVLRNRSHILIFMPYVEHESFHESFIFWDVDEVRDYIKNLLIALNRVHQCGIIHRDVKPSNFLYDRKRKQYALVDFGLAQTYEKSTSDSNIFVYEKLNKKPAAATPSADTKKNLISISSSSKKSTSSHLILTNTQLQQQQNRVTSQTTTSTTPKTDVNSMPHNSSSAAAIARQMSSSQSFDRNLSRAAAALDSPAPNKTAAQDENKMPTPSNPVQNRVLNAVNSSSGFKVATGRTASPNLQKFHSFHKSNSFLFDAKCNCFNTQFVCDICTTRNNKWAPRAGTAGFRAPEILFRSSYQTPAIDVWSAGIIFLSLLSGRYPFFKAVDDTMAIMQLVSLFGVESVRKGAFKYGECLICSYEKKSVDMKELCIDLRINMIKGIKEHKSKKKYIDKDIDSIRKEFPDSAYDLLKKLLEIDCEKRLTAENALNHPFFTQ